jgi:hypothetical protein
MCPAEGSKFRFLKIDGRIGLAKIACSSQKIGCAIVRTLELGVFRGVQLREGPARDRNIQ